jgi:predicted Zn-dependent protease
MEEVKGYWYNGISSRPDDVILKADIVNRKLLLEVNEQITEWLFDDLNIEISGSSVHIYNKTLLSQSIFITNLPFGKLLKQFSGSGKSLYDRLVHAGLSFHLFLAALITGLICLTYFFAVPFIAEKSVNIIPETYDRSMGENFFQNYIKYRETDSSLSAAVQQFADVMKLDATYNIRITVVNSDEKNAFALPGGHIVVFTGILKLMDDYPELAALLSHEAAHVKNRHSMKMMARNLAGYLLISAVLSDVNGIMALFANNANQLGILSYSRRFEEEADQDGWRTLKKNNIDPQGMVKLFSRLKKEEKFAMPAFLSTHPLTDDRIKAVKDKIRRQPFPVKKNQRLAAVYSEIQHITSSSE